MIAEEMLHPEHYPEISISEDVVVLHINKLMCEAVPNFRKYIASDFYKKRKLNEDDFTQIYIEQAQILIRKNGYPFNINGQYRDITNLSKGFSDLYFYSNEENASTSSIYSVECKRLPAPDMAREKEYVIGDNNNGGIERYKTEKHGKGLKVGGLFGFVEAENFKYWEAKINTWIIDMSMVNSSWHKDEILHLQELKENYCRLHSVAHRNDNDINLNHLWISVN